MHTIEISGWTLWIQDKELPDLYPDYLKHARFIDQIDIHNPAGQFFFLAISNVEAASDWPSTVIVQKYQNEWGATPGILIVPETNILFIGAGDRLLCYDIGKQKRLWEDSCDLCFWELHRSGPYVLMSAELEFGVWTIEGEKLWSTFVEPPWSYKVSGDIVALDVMGNTRLLNLSDGSSAK
ncbi:hypothetical protein [Pseudaestuariivita rosea]|uniref:hypothetical protein n=1 Tax=Pseudaestuariivita rosea TaxID=2763263 RepID=UPI001ABA14E5|nr:hypothetical protein [Pseudaestuariivita rosea]